MGSRIAARLPLVFGLIGFVIGCGGRQEPVPPKEPDQKSPPPAVQKDDGPEVPEAVFKQWRGAGARVERAGKNRLGMFGEVSAAQPEMKFTEVMPLFRFTGLYFSVGGKEAPLDPPDVPYAIQLPSAGGEEVLIRLRHFRKLTALLTQSSLIKSAEGKLREMGDLSVLVLGDYGVDDSHLATIATLKQLRHLEVRSPLVTDEGLTHLHQLLSLEFLALLYTKVSPAAVKAFQAARPGCRVRVER